MGNELDDLDNNFDEQKFKNALLEQIENFINGILMLCPDSRYLEMLYILKMEVGSEFVTLKDLKVYCDILCALVKVFKKSDELDEEINKLDEETKTELQKLRGKTEIFRKLGSYVSETELLKKDMLRSVFITLPAIVLGVTIAAVVGMGALIWGVLGALVAITIINLGIMAVKNWRINKVLQKTQEIAKEIPETSQEKQMGQEEKNAKTVDQDKTLILYIKNDLLRQVEKLKKEVSIKYNNKYTKKLSELEANIKKLNALDDLQKECNNLCSFANTVKNHPELDKINFSVFYYIAKNVVEGIDLEGIISLLKSVNRKIELVKNKLEQNQSSPQNQNENQSSVLKLQIKQNPENDKIPKNDKTKNEIEYN